MRKTIFAASLIALALGACTPPAAGPSQQAMALPSCESPAAAVALGGTMNGQIAAVQSYPENARYFCFQVPEGTGSVTISLSGLTADLDLFVGSNGIASVQGQEIQQGQTYEWMSRNEGTADDSVTITAPRAGVYYVEIVSYQGEASSYSLSVN